MFQFIEQLIQTFLISFLVLGQFKQLRLNLGDLSLLDRCVLQIVYLLLFSLRLIDFGLVLVNLVFVSRLTPF